MNQYHMYRLFLIDASIGEYCISNSRKSIDRKIIRKIACIANFIEELQISSTFVGERGIKLSGGQKQRIGIARAIYRDSKFMFFDEATSALDMETEKNVIKSINKFTNDITLIMIAHRLDSLKNCDKIIKFKSRKIEVVSPEEIFK